MINVRKLAAVDLAFLGPRLILPEFALGVFGPAAIGIVTLFRSHSAGAVLLGGYFVALGINYIPLLLHAISLVRHGTARAEVADEAGDRTQLFRHYRRQSLWLLVPFVVPLMALVQARRARLPRVRS